MAEGTKAARAGIDDRPPLLLLRQFDKITTVRKSLVKMGAVEANATPEEVIAALRRYMPTHLFTGD